MSIREERHFYIKRKDSYTSIEDKPNISYEIEFSDGRKTWKTPDKLSDFYEENKARIVKMTQQHTLDTGRMEKKVIENMNDFINALTSKKPPVSRDEERIPLSRRAEIYARAAARNSRV